MLFLANIRPWIIFKHSDLIEIIYKSKPKYSCVPCRCKLHDGSPEFL